MIKKLIFFVVFLLLIPLIAMQFTSEVNWNFLDFLLAGFLLFSMILIFNFFKRKINNIKLRNMIYIIVMILFLIIWIDLAVGILD
tara:strand:- start:410 stop:664 length:255 start_codon:yes stop_codon:yes gene_type:complete